jgi:hypothetical protein
VRGISLESLEIETDGEIDLRGFLGIDPTVPQTQSFGMPLGREVMAMLKITKSITCENSVRPTFTVRPPIGKIGHPTADSQPEFKSTPNKIHYNSLPWTSFDRIVARYGGDVRVRSLRCGE